MEISRQSQRRRPPNGWRASDAAAQPEQPDRPARGRSIDPIDAHVGSRLRVARKAMNLTQEGLAAQLGITFQQLQKYEKGVNRISASRLHYAARILGVPVAFFFPQAEAEASAGPATDHPIADAMSFLSSEDGIELCRIFVRIEDAAVRRQVIDLLRSIAKSLQ